MEYCLITYEGGNDRKVIRERRVWFTVLPELEIKKVEFMDYEKGYKFSEPASSKSELGRRLRSMVLKKESPLRYSNGLWRMEPRDFRPEDEDHILKLRFAEEL